MILRAWIPNGPPYAWEVPFKRSSSLAVPSWSPTKLHFSMCSFYLVHQPQQFDISSLILISTKQKGVKLRSEKKIYPKGLNSDAPCSTTNEMLLPVLEKSICFILYESKSSFILLFSKNAGHPIIHPGKTTQSNMSTIQQQQLIFCPINWGQSYGFSYVIEFHPLLYPHLYLN